MTEDLIARLRSAVAGPVLVAGDDGYAEELSGFNLAVTHTPEIVVGLTSEADAVAVVRAAAESGTPVRVLATGHGIPNPIQDGIVVTTTRMTGVIVDAEDKVAHIPAGSRWGEVISAAAPHGLAPIAGASDAVGCIGYTLGGGLGPLARTYGFSSDWVREFRIVTGSGEAVTANVTENQDLFWALRGGKGGFGIVTSMDFELVELSTLYGGSVFFDAEYIAPVLSTWVGWTKDLPENANSSVVVLRLPPLEFIPEPLRGKTVINVRFAYVGEAVAGKKLFRSIRAAGTPLIDALGDMPASDIALIHNDPKDPTPSWDRGMLLEEIDAEFVAAFLDAAGPDQQIPLIAVEMRHLGGATERDVPEGTAVGGRSGAYTLTMIGVPDPSLFGQVLPATVDGILAKVEPWVSAETTVNFAGGFALPGSFKASWPDDTFARLAGVRAAYDPNKVFPYGPS
ncbi:FAD-binding oxidoreductase [Kribbella kalugense]|uniref:FAD/FMN-containing dehydrogenase n=1 Tax=Kribbella kalugense TaxID=2512221 RepID=A0A4R7ZUG7_9ACTN|nr:FAD-binding oxidoreductase [Kribbella kalugense]TDW21743.1 FAD/FMN-containing dehydrogenase [Kribbella kalugense]